MLSVIAGVIVVFLVYWLYQEKDKLAQVALGMIIGGAVGNVIDRIRLGAVLTFGLSHRRKPLAGFQCCRQFYLHRGYNIDYAEFI